MDDKVNYTLVGAFVLALGTALIVAVLWLAHGIDTKKKYEPYQSIFAESVAGLSVAAPVKYLGVDVGKVSEIAIDPDSSRKVRVKFLIERGTPIKEDTQAVLKSQGLTGIAYVELSAGSPGSPPLVSNGDGPVPTIVSMPSLSARLEDVLTSGIANFEKTSANLNAVLNDENRTAFKQILLDTATLAHALSGQQAAMTNAIADTAKTAQNAARASDQLGPVIARVRTSAEAIGRMADEVSRTSARANRTVDAATDAIDQIGTGALPQVERLTTEFDDLARSMRALSEQMQRAPNSLLVGAPKRPLGPGEVANP